MCLWGSEFHFGCSWKRFKNEVAIEYVALNVFVEYFWPEYITLINLRINNYIFEFHLTFNIRAS